LYDYEDYGDYSILFGLQGGFTSYTERDDILSEIKMFSYGLSTKEEGPTEVFITKIIFILQRAFPYEQDI
jgi:hypothetical protein